jgi:hypothetical protein
VIATETFPDAPATRLSGEAETVKPAGGAEPAALQAMVGAEFVPVTVPVNPSWVF